MRQADAAWLGMEQPENRLVVAGVLRLTGVPDLEDLRARVQDRVVGHHPRLRQVARRPALPLLRPRWHADPAFDVVHHVVDLTPAEPCDDEGLARLAGGLVAQPLDPERPAWQIHLVRRAGGGSALVARFHHSLADGIALASVLLRLTDEEAPAPDGDGAPPTPRPSAARRSTTAVRAAVSMVTTLVRLVLTLGEPQTHLRRPLGTAKVLALTSPHDLEDVRQVARAHGVSINDVLLAATAGGLRRHLVERGSPVADLRVIVPVDLRGGAPVPRGLGNVFGAVVVGLPVGEPDPSGRLRAVAVQTARLTRSAEPGGMYLLLRVVGGLPRVVQRLAAALLGSSASAVVTNVPGPRSPLAVGTCAVEDVAFWVPTVGRIGLGVSLFSYAGTLTVGVAVDARLDVDAAGIARAIEAEISILDACDGGHRSPGGTVARRPSR